MARELEQAINRVFVYGTLCRGQGNEAWWPHSPQRVQAAFVAGRLFDLGPYPALKPGERCVRGEVWTISADQMTNTLARLDELEGYSQRDDDLYERVIVHCHLDSPSGPAVTAYTYYYLRNPPVNAEVQPNATGVCSWRS